MADISVLDKTAETAAVVAIGGDSVAGHIATLRGFVLDPAEAAGVDATGYIGAGNAALGGGDIVPAGGVVTQLAGKTADTAGAGGRDRGLDDSATIEIDTADAAAYETADHGFVIRCVGGDGA